VVKEAGCFAGGEMLFTCSVCRATSTEPLQALGSHSWDAGVVTREALCLTSGVKTFTCTVCAETRNETIPMKGKHQWNDGMVSVAPLCETEGTKQFTCMVCGHTKTEKISPIGYHSWNEGSVTEEPKCLMEGVKTFTCTVCAQSKTEDIAAIGAHSWTSLKTTGTQKTYRCDICAKEKTAYLPIVEELYTDSKSTAETVFLDRTVLRDGEPTYCITSATPTYLSIEWQYRLKPNTTYVVSGEIKTENVVSHEDTYGDRGANICAGDYYNNSTAILGDSDWESVYVLVTTGSSGVLKVSMNLGYFYNDCTGTAWFHGLTVREVADYAEECPTWNYLFVALGNTSLHTYDEELKKQLDLSGTMTEETYRALCKCVEDFETDLERIADGMFRVKADVIRCDAEMNDYTKGTSGYYIKNTSAYQYLNEQNIDIDDYDHVIFVADFPDLPRKYFGLGGTMINDKRGFSLIVYGGNVSEYCYNITQKNWPAGVYVHEFLHTMDTYGRWFGSTGANPDGAETYGYPNVDHWRTFYADIIHDRVLYKDEYIGVDPFIWQIPPRLLEK